MTTQSYYGSGEYDHFNRTSHRSMSNGAYYERPTAYGYYEQPRQELRSEYGGRPVTRAMIQEPEPDIGTGSSRRRIAVACSRCRRRKIKCSGDPGDGSGCQACRASGADTHACNFIRVGTLMPPGGGAVEVYPQASSGNGASQTGGYATDTPPAPGWLGAHHHPQTRTSLPTLHTRSSFIDGYDQYENSPVDSYTYASATIPRQDSFASSYGSGSVENYRSWSTSSAPMSAPVTTGYYEQQPAYSFGNLQAPSFPQPSNNRLPSVTADSFSSLNMGSLHSSLPIQTAQERTLPAPYTVHYSQTSYPTAEQLPVPEIRPLGSFNEPRVHINGIHSRTAMPWSSEDSSTGSRTMSAGNSMAPITGIPGPSTQRLHHPHVPTPVSEPVLGYQFLPTSGSPDISPASGPAPESFSSTASSTSSTVSMPPPSANFRYAQALPALNTDDRPMTSSSSSREGMAASLYSFSTDTGERPVTSGSDHASSSTVSGGHNYVPLRQPQPQHAASVEALRRQSSFDQQRAATAHRMSVSNLNARY
ncbi:hypothetical protein LTR36_004671 [Oleoguttula mirabilis]|uniref:Zn(2)-C6 fungal-type domain-containing protein n=1 Tax=Oleoguttula mirabilis TaxID=1507867 RepID=A0AAV9JFV6_9PEZI|nr:hypothetical protein LTR36_004671 [Oleoguttula mirabilis]